MKNFWFLAVLALPVLCLPAPVLAFGFDDLEVIERAEQTELLDLARRAAEAWRFDEARDYLAQARNRNDDPSAVAAVEQVLAQQQQRAEDQRRQQEEAQRAAAASGGGGRRLASTVSGSFAGRCPSSGYHDRAKTSIRFSDGGYGTLIVRCERGCWTVQIFPLGPTATNCGEFGSGSWAGGNGDRWLNQYGASLNDVAHWMMSN